MKEYSPIEHRQTQADQAVEGRCDREGTVGLGEKRRVGTMS